MANFDALRPAVVGPLSYLCKPAPPVELLGCWPLISDYSDKSRYGNTASGGGSAYINVNGFTGAPFDKCWGFQENLGLARASLVLPFRLDLSMPFSIDWIGYFSGVSGCRLIFGNLNFSYENGWGQAAGYPKGINWNGTNIKSFIPYKDAQGHYALRYTGTTLYYYENGGVKQSVNVPLSGIVTSMSTESDNTGYSGTHIANFRVVQKALGSTSYYPVPSTPYTGFEAL